MDDYLLLSLLHECTDLCVTTKLLSRHEMRVQTMSTRTLWILYLDFILDERCNCLQQMAKLISFSSAHEYTVRTCSKVQTRLHGACMRMSDFLLTVPLWLT